MPNSANIIEQYHACLTTAALYRRHDRGLIELRGADRTDWLNNLVTNVLTTLSPGEGNYAFATKRDGRTVFDLNMLVLDDRLWLDLDRRLVSKAMAHLDHHLITEDVTITDVTPHVGRIAVLGPAAGRMTDRLQLGNLVAMASLQHVPAKVDGASVRMMRHDFSGVLGGEFFASSELGAATIEQIASKASEMGLKVVERTAVDILRIEAGIPASVDDIDEEVLPPETGQIERGISYQKGCYLGQEVIERMRSRGGLARQLVGLRFDCAEPLPRGSKLVSDGKQVGRVMSGCYSEALNAPLSLAYVKTTSATPDAPLIVETDAGHRQGAVLSLPVRPLAKTSA